MSDNPFTVPQGVGSQVVASVAQDFGIAPAELIGPFQPRCLVHPRAVVAMLLRRHGGKSLQQIGRILGGRDHTTVHHAIQQFDIYCRQSETVAASYARHLKLIEEAEALAAEVAA